MNPFPKLVARLFFALAIILVVEGCSSMSPKGAPTAEGSLYGGQKTLTLLYSNSRQQEVEPCGCSLAPKGGLVREWNIIEEWKKKGMEKYLYLLGGVSFAPADFSPESLEFYKRRADFMATSVQELGARALSLDVADLSLGVDTIKAMEKKVNYPFLSANIVDKQTGTLLFKAYEEIETGAMPILLIGISTVRGKSAYPIPKSVGVQDPVEALKKVFEKAGDKPRLVVLLSSLSDAETTAVSKAFPQINVVLGGTGAATGEIAAILDRRQIYMNTPSMGHALARLDIPMGKPIERFYNKDSVEGPQFELAQVESKLKNWKEPTSKPSRKQPKGAKPPESREHLQAEWNRLTAITAAPDEKATLFSSQGPTLYKSYDLPDNRMTQMISAFKEATRAYAIQEDDEEEQGENVAAPKKKDGRGIADDKKSSSPKED